MSSCAAQSPTGRIPMPTDQSLFPNLNVTLVPTLAPPVLLFLLADLHLSCCHFQSSIEECGSQQGELVLSSQHHWRLATTVLHTVGTRHWLGYYSVMKLQASNFNFWPPWRTQHLRRWYQPPGAAENSHRRSRGEPEHHVQAATIPFRVFSAV